MAKKKPRPQKPRDDMPAETQAADVLTVAWMLAVLTSLLCQIGAVITRWIALGGPQGKALDVFSAMLFFAAMAIGLFTLGLIPVLLKIRKSPPPTTVLVFVIVVSVAPWVTLLVQALL